MKVLGEFLLFHALICAASHVQGIIINGEFAPEGSMQFMVSVQTENGHVCGGFLISEDFVVTAAHCDIGLKHVILGGHNWKNSNVKKIEISNQYKHKNYKEVGYGYDIMLLKLANKAPMGENIKTIPLAENDMNLSVNQECSVAGWGKTESTGDLVDDLRVVNVPIIDHNDCQQSWPDLPTNVICAGGKYTVKGFCQGDGGGPLLCNGKAVGIVSFNKNCKYPDVPNVYTDIREYVEWITDQGSGTKDQRPTTDEIQPTTNDQRPTTKDQQPTTSDQLPTTNDQGQTTKDQGLMTKHQGPTIKDQGPTTKDQGPTIKDQGPRTSDQGPTTKDQRQRTNNQGPTTKDQQPRTTNQGPTTKDQQLKTKDQGPRTKEQGPKTQDQRPKTKDQGLRTNDQEPSTNDQGPSTNDQGSRTKDQGSRTNDRGPRTKDQGPRTKDQAPKTKDQRPKIKDQEQRTKDIVPKTNNQGPRINVQGPRTNDQGPKTDDQRPRTNDQGPKTKDQGPRTNDQGPITDDQGPRTKDQEPRTKNQGPRTNDQGPRTKDQEPMTKEQGPRTKDQRPMTNDQQPTNNVRSLERPTTDQRIIINKKLAPKGSMQFMVSVQNRNGHVCGGFLISEDFVVTAAHCDSDLKHVILGGHNRKSSNVKKIEIRNQYRHNNYRQVEYGYDIMLLKLANRAPMGENIQTIPLAENHMILSVNQECFVAGWGMIENTGGLVDDLRVVNVPIIDYNDCLRSWDGLPPNVICAGEKHTDKGVCQGDGGGPLVCNGKAVGIVSFRKIERCIYPTVPNVYTDIREYVDWITMTSRQSM